jgi:hypothetical protein
MASPPASKDRRKADLDLEKGKSAASSQKPKTTTTITSTFDVESPQAKSWKSKLLDAATGKGGGK